MWVDISGLHLSLLLGLVFVVPSLLGGVWPNVTQPLNFGSVLFLLAAVGAHLNAFNPTVSLDWLDFLARLMLVSLLASTLMTTPRRVLAVIAVVAGSLGFHASKAGLLSLLMGGVQFADGLAGAFIDNNGYALATVMIMPLLLAVAQNTDLLFEGFAANTRRWIRRGLLLSLPACAMTVVSTFSRGGLLALVAATMAYIVMHPRRWRVAMALCVVLPILVTVAPIPKGYRERIDSIQTYDKREDQSALGRLHFWRVAVIMAADRPFGVGLRNFDYAYDRYDPSNGAFGVKRAVHNSHFQVLAELGWAGAVIWLVQLGLAFWYALRVRSRSRTPGLSPAASTFLLTTANGIICSMVGFVVGGSFIALALNDLTWLTFAILASLDRISREMCARAKQNLPMAA
jgi:probable O-glycosylation ligase (exosortase A-associated)